jgi:hypothetical protein
MNYIIKTPSATKLTKEIIDCVSSKVDANGKGIATWQCVETDASEKVLVHTTDQWAEKGCLTIKHDISRNELQVRFHYWETCDIREDGDDKFMLSRFTELILVHFSYFVDKIVIE